MGWLIILRFVISESWMSICQYGIACLWHFPENNLAKSIHSLILLCYTNHYVPKMWHTHMCIVMYWQVLSLYFRIFLHFGLRLYMKSISDALCVWINFIMITKVRQTFSLRLHEISRKCAHVAQTSASYYRLISIAFKWHTCECCCYEKWSLPNWF